MTYRQYSREDVDYATWYSSWSQRLALTKTRDELERLLGKSSSSAEQGAKSHLRAIESTGSMNGQSARRAHARNVTAAAGDYAIAISGALEIHDLFPEHALQGGQP